MLLEPQVVVLDPPEAGYGIIVVPELIDGRLIYVARHPELPRCMSQGDTPDEAIASLNEVREEYLADMLSQGIAVAAPTDSPAVHIMNAPDEDAPQTETWVRWQVTLGQAEVEQH